MTRMFYHLICLLLFINLASCSLFQSDNKMGADELEGGAIAQDSEEIGDTEFDDMDDLDVETADAPGDTTAQAGSSDSFDDIEDFNSDMIEGELAKEDLSDEDFGPTADSSNEASPPADEFNLESSDMPPTEQTVIVPEVDDGMSTSFADSGSANNKITNLEYKSFASGGTVVISAEQPFQYQVREEPEFNQVIIEVANVNLPQSLKRPYIAKDFGQPVATINAYQDKGSTTARFVIQYKNAVKPTVEQKDNSLVVMNNPSSGGMSASASDSVLGGKGAGKTISLQVDNIDVKEVIKLIAAESGVNILVDSDVAGQTTVRLNDVPWDEALMTILKSHGLGYKKQGNILRIASQEKLATEAKNYNLQVSSEIDAKRQSEGQRVRFFPINYASVEDLVTQVTPFLTKDVGKVSADKRSNALVVVDFTDVLEKVERMVKALDIPPMQILIEGKIIEASEDFSRSFGANLTSVQTTNLGSQFLNSSISTTPAINAAEGVNFSLTAGTFDVLGSLTATLALEEKNSNVKILSSPRVMVLNKETANISQVNQSPVITTTPVANSGIPLQTITFQDFKLSLQVTPQITFNGEVLMDVEVMREVPGAETRGALKKESRTAKTKVLVPNGKTMVIGGIYQNDVRDQEAGVPFLKDIPILGYLFKSNKKSIQKNELLIFLTPKIVNPELLKQAFNMSKDQSETTESPNNSFNNEVDELNGLEEELDVL